MTRHTKLYKSSIRVSFLSFRGSWPYDGSFNILLHISLAEDQLKLSHSSSTPVVRIAASHETIAEAMSSISHMVCADENSNATKSENQHRRWTSNMLFGSAVQDSTRQAPQLFSGTSATTPFFSHDGEEHSDPCTTKKKLEQLSAPLKRGLLMGTLRERSLFTSRSD